MDYSALYDDKEDFVARSMEEFDAMEFKLESQPMVKKLVNLFNSLVFCTSTNSLFVI